MAIPLIALQAQPIEPTNFLRGMQIRQQQDQLTRQNALLDTQTKAAKLQYSQEQEDFLGRNIVDTAYNMLPHLANGDVEGAKTILAQTRDRLRAQGLDLPPGAVDQALDSGDIHGALGAAQTALQHGVARGWIKSPESQATNEEKNLRSLGLTPGTPEYSQAFQRIYGKADPNAITPYQQAQLGIEQAKLQELRANNASDRDIKQQELEVKRITAGQGKAPTESQAKANAFAGEMDLALKDADTALAEMKSTRPSRFKQIIGAIPAVGNVTQRWISSPAEQKYFNATKRFISAKLRADSGATITNQEIEQQLDQYMPKATDSDEVVRQKHDALQTLIQSVRSRGTASAPAIGAPASAQPQAAAQAPQISEGQTATNPQTGEKIIFRGGQWQRQ